MKRIIALTISLLALVTISCNKTDPEYTPVPAPGGSTLPGAFTIDGQGKTIHFAKGNLMMDITDTKGSWTFWEEQYLYQDGWKKNKRDLFGWSSTKSGYGLELSDVRLYNRDKFIDWGNIFGSGSHLRTLDAAEWSFILFGRETASRYAKAVIKLTAETSTNGLIILPDNFICPEGLSLSKTDVPTAPYKTNVLSIEDWKSLESAGCVFLPAGGYGYYDKEIFSTDGLTHSGLNAEGNYWSSDIDTEVSLFHRPYALHFNESKVEVIPMMHVDEEHKASAYARSVRLIYE